MSRVHLICPQCSKKGFIEVSSDRVKDTSRGVYAINVTEDVICSHSFIAYIDKNFQVRDYFSLDYSIETPEIIIDDASLKLESLKEQEINLYLLKLNFSPNLLSFILRSIFFKKSILLISENLFLNQQLLILLNIVFSNTFNYDLAFSSLEEYKSSKKFYKNHVIFKGSKVINNPNKIIGSQKLKIEKKIIYDFYSAINDSEALNNLKNGIDNLYRLSKEAIEFLSDQSDSKKINIVLIENHLQEKFNIDVQKEYINFLLDIIRNYFEFILPRIYDSFISFL